MDGKRDRVVNRPLTTDIRVDCKSRADVIVPYVFEISTVELFKEIYMQT